MSSVNFPAHAGVRHVAPSDPCDDVSHSSDSDARRSAFKPVVPGLGGLKPHNRIKAEARDFQYAGVPKYHDAGQSLQAPTVHPDSGRPVSPVLPQYPNIQFIGENPVRQVMGPDGNVRLRSFRDDMREVFRQIDSIPPGHDLLAYTNRIIELRNAENERRAQSGEPMLPPLDCFVELGRNTGAHFRPFDRPGPDGVGGTVTIDPTRRVPYGDTPGELFPPPAMVAAHEIIHHNEAANGLPGNEHKTSGLEEGYDITENLLREWCGAPIRQTYRGRQHIPSDVTMQNSLSSGKV